MLMMIHEVPLEPRPMRHDMFNTAFTAIYQYVD